MKKKVLAKVNGKEITEQELNLMLKTLGPERAKQFQNKKGREILINELINQNLYLADAIDNNLAETDEFKAQMKIAKENILKQMNINKTMATINISEPAVKKYYQDNKEKFKSKEKVTASHILVSSKEQCKEILEEIQTDDMKFSQAAKKYSKCPSKTKAGSLGTFGKGKMVPEFEKAVFSMEVGEISEPVKTQFGYHLIRLDDKQESGQMSYQVAKKEITSHLQKEAQKKVYMQKVKKLKDKYEVIVF